jgi:hypothetical protein
MTVSVLSPTKQEFLGKVYYACGFYFQRKGERLHRAVWEWHYGPVPKGFHVHHVDGDRSNNDIRNLALIETPKHMSLHQQGREEYQAKHIKEMQELAKAWHGSGEGKEWHREHGKASWKNRGMIRHTCIQCGKEYEVKSSISRFCGGNCKAQYRRDSGVDNVQRRCRKCGGEFVTNMYSPAMFCSKECRKG